MKRTQRLNLTSWLTTGLLTWLLSGLLGFTSLAFAEEP
ncbi:flagellar biosynthetic protein FliP, partial [Vibrio cholerae]|nr:flagellar biosynthetic protein FliP [Vibrio cholerae]